MGAENLQHALILLKIVHLDDILYNVVSKLVL